MVIPYSEAILWILLLFQISIPRDQCTPATFESGGSLFNLDRAEDARFAPVWAQRVALSAKKHVPEQDDCNGQEHSGCKSNKIVKIGQGRQDFKVNYWKVENQWFELLLFQNIIDISYLGNSASLFILCCQLINVLRNVVDCHDNLNKFNISFLTYALLEINNFLARFSVINCKYHLYIITLLTCIKICN